jgi:two-component system, LytTR family, sensor kinase
MMKARMNIRSWGFWHFQTLGWSLFATSHFLANILSVGVQSPMVWWFLLQPAAGFVVTLGMREVYRNIRYQQIPILLVVFLCVLGGATAAMISLGVNLTIARLLFGPSSFWEYLNPVRLATSFSFLFPVYMVWCVLYFGIRIWSDYLGERDRADEAVASAQQAQMQMLRYHLHPHFLFNTLNSVRALIDADPPQARAMITELSEFLRYSLISRNRQEVTIAEEMQAVHQYLSLEKRRFENKLEVSLSIEDGARERTLPSFLIHPLVENAIIHGMRTSAMPLRVSVTARVREFGLSVEVTNTGRWLDVLAGNGGDEPDTGLENVRARLAHVYPGRHRFSTFERDGAVHAMLELLPRSEQLQ